MSSKLEEIYFRPWGSMSSSDFSRVRGKHEKRWLGRSYSCPAMIPYTKAESAFQKSLQESPTKKLRTSRETDEE